MGSLPRPATVPWLFAPLRAWALRSGARRDLWSERTRAIQGWGEGMVVAGGAAQSSGPALSGSFPWVLGTSPSGKGRILTSA